MLLNPEVWFLFHFVALKVGPIPANKQIIIKIKAYNTGMLLMQKFIAVYLW